MFFMKRVRVVEGLSAGSTASVRIPIGNTIHQLYMTMGGDLTAADISEIRLVVNGKNIMRFPGGGTQLDLLNRYEGRADSSATGILTLDLERYGMLTRQARMITALGTGLPFDATTNPFPATNVVLELDLKSDAGPALALDVKARYSPATITGVVKLIKPFTYSAQGAGEFEITDIPLGDLINKIHFFSDQINALTIERDGFILYEATKAENTLLATEGVRVPQTGVFTYDPTSEGYGAETLATRKADGTRVQDMRFRLDMAAASNFTMLVEYIGALGN